MCKEMPVIPFKRVMDKKRIRKMEGQGGGEAPPGVADQIKKNKPVVNSSFFSSLKSAFFVKLILRSIF
jgi:hypothetical protein